MEKVKVKTGSCECDMKYLCNDDKKSVKNFFAAHPFMTGYLAGLISHKDFDLFELLNEVVRENFGNPNGWGRR